MEKQLPKTESPLDQQRVHMRRMIESAQERFKLFVEAARAFLNEGNTIELAVLKDGKKALRDILYYTEDGAVDEGMQLYRTGERLGLPRDREQYRKSNPDFLEALARACGHAGFMRGPYGEMSHTVPQALKQEMIAAEIAQLEKIAKLWREQKDKANFEALQLKGTASFQAIQERANPYIAADMYVKIANGDEYQKLREEFRRLSIDSKDVYEVGESSALLTSFLLTQIYPEEYQKALKGYQEKTLDLPTLQARNQLVVQESKRDEEFAREHPYKY